MKEHKDILEKYGITIYLRNGRWYWMIKSKSFDSSEGALKDAISIFAGKPSQK